MTSRSEPPADEIFGIDPVLFNQTVGRLSARPLQPPWPTNASLLRPSAPSQAMTPVDAAETLHAFLPRIPVGMVLQNPSAAAQALTSVLRDSRGRADVDYVLSWLAAARIALEEHHGRTL